MAGDYTPEERRAFKIKAQLKSWGLALLVDCDRCKAYARQRCTSLVPDEKGRLLNWPHDSRMDKAWQSLADSVPTGNDSQFTDLK